MRGILEQYVICIPKNNLIITRLGHHRGKTTLNSFPSGFYTYIDEDYKMMRK